MAVLGANLAPAPQARETSMQEDTDWLCKVEWRRAENLPLFQTIAISVSMVTFKDLAPVPTLILEANASVSFERSGMKIFGGELWFDGQW